MPFHLPQRKKCRCGATPATSSAVTTRRSPGSPLSATATPIPHLARPRRALATLDRSEIPPAILYLLSASLRTAPAASPTITPDSFFAPWFAASAPSLHPPDDPRPSPTTPSRSPSPSTGSPTSSAVAPAKRLRPTSNAAANIQSSISVGTR